MSVDLGTQLDLLLRLAIGLILGAVVGWEREMQRMPAGFRTHALVGLGSALFTVVSAYAFTGANADPTRIAAQIVTGIGFLGGGVILHHGGNVRGLTTAASLWSVAAIGMASGAALYLVAVGGTVLAIVALELFQRLEHALRRSGRAGIGPARDNVDAIDPEDARTDDLP
jgi:putative Mg2+ transporter-C (MgtC) family protein